MIADDAVGADQLAASAVVIGSLSAGMLVTESEGIGSNDNDTTVATSAAIKDYVDTQITAQDLDITDGTDSIAIDLDSEVLSVLGGTGVTSTASFTLTYTDSLIDVVPDPTQPLFYNVERGGFISTADSTVIDYNQITFDNSKYDGTYSVVGVATTSFVLSLLKDPELSLYTADNTTIMKYSTDSKNASGPISKLRMVSEGNDYKQLPGISSITTLNGSDAILFAQSPTVGNIKEIRVIDQAFEYNTDKSLRPEANIPSTLELRSNLTITDVQIVDGGDNYTTAPEVAIVDSITGERIDDGILTTEVQSSSVSAVNIFEQPTGLNFNSKNLFTVNNSNGVGISTMQTSTSGIVTCFLSTPLLGFSTSIFSAVSYTHLTLPTKRIV